MDFLRGRGIQRSDRVYHELVAWCEVLKLLGEYDQLNLGALAGVEKLTRKVNGIIEAYGSSGAVSWRMAGVLEGTAGHLDAISPALRQWGVRRIKDQNELEAGRSRVAPPTQDGEGALEGAGDVSGRGRCRGGDQGRGRGRSAAQPPGDGG